ncbi:hypothetical protein L210DRAFT_3505979 [Boletus edulis BED1]|uniref:Heterokaryon incompatibility domain-containing protein n=1 Tax=Boletus edulis BED1 TaxID=1328754 RepID=A0AAD4BPN5_BOLED|nr:hypothetical protein L210DRAFT_3505979 [Boletus edulis BED1]
MHYFLQLIAEIYRAICDRLEVIDRIADAMECFHEMMSELGGETKGNDEYRAWVLDFKQRSSEKLDHLGDTAVSAQRYDEAISHYSTVLSLTLFSPQAIFIKRSKARLASGSWKEALDDANEVIGLDPSSPWGYEIKRAALHKGGDYDDAIDALEMMLTKMAESRDPDVQRLGDQYISPSSTRATIRKIVHQTLRSFGMPEFNWAWSDTCCIDKSDHFILQEALVAMFKWYQGAAMMIVFLRGVRPSSPRGALAGSIWNTRAWTLQEYIAAKVIRFYTEDWTLYRDIELPNHKESPEIISEMEQATGVSAGQLIPLHPGLGCIREKLCLASTRKTTWVEDAAYSLLGIFSAIGIPAIYGEGEASLGRSIGECAHEIWRSMSHLPAPIPNSEMGRTVTGLHTPSFDLDVALRLYDRLNELPTPRFAESRMTLPCIAFKLPSFSVHRTSSGRVYHADTTAFGMVEVRTRYDLSRMRSLYLVQPWLDTLLEHEDTRGGAFVENGVVLQPSGNSDDEEISDEEADYEEIDDDSSPPPRSPPLPSPVEIEPVDRETGARRLAARLRQPFGALLLQQAQTGRRVMEYRRVAADCLITVRFQDDVSLADILDNPWYCSTRAFHGSDRNIHLMFDDASRPSSESFSPSTLTSSSAATSGLPMTCHSLPYLCRALPFISCYLSPSYQEDDVLLPPTPNMDDEEISGDELDNEGIDDDDDWSLSEPELPSTPTPAQTAPVNRETGARQLVARLRQPFGALLLTVASTGRRDGAVDYKRVAADSLITVQLQESVSLADILDNIRVLDVL